MVYEILYGTINSVATLDLCWRRRARNFGDGVHINIGVIAVEIWADGAVSAWSQEWFQGCTLAKTGLGYRMNFAVSVRVGVNLNYLIGLSVGARSGGVIQRFAFERRDMGCWVSAFLVRAITDINKPIGSVWNVWRLFARFRNLCQDGRKQRGCRSRTDRSCATQPKMLSLFAMFGCLLMGDGSGEVTSHFDGITNGPWRKNNRERRSLVHHGGGGSRK